MAFRREVFAKVGLFDANRGRKGTLLAGGEDGEIFARIQSYELKTGWPPAWNGPDMTLVGEALAMCDDRMEWEFGR